MGIRDVPKEHFVERVHGCQVIILFNELELWALSNKGPTGLRSAAPS